MTAATHTLTLYHYWRSSCSWRVRWALACKNVTYQSIAVNILSGEHQQADYLARNPAGFLPALLIDGHCYGESLALIDWLEETYPNPPLYPKQAEARLRVRQLALTIATGTQPLQNPSLIQHFVPLESERQGHLQHFIKRGLGIYETLLERGQPGLYSEGDQISVADLCLIPQVYNALRFAVNLEAMPLLRAIYQRCLQLPECLAAAPERHQPASASAPKPHAG